jgi:hypothetical protein
MAAKVEFQDFSIKCKDALEDAVIQFLEEASGELESQAIRNSDFSKDVKNNWKHVVDESKKEATIGNSLELAIWTEFGTGEYALEGKGRKGYWVYVKGNSSVKEANPGKARTLEEAKMAVAILREQGLEAYYTKGQKPRRMLHNAFETKKAAIIRRAEQVFKGRLK